MKRDAAVSRDWFKYDRDHRSSVDYMVVQNDKISITYFVLKLAGSFLQTVDNCFNEHDREYSLQGLLKQNFSKISHFSSGVQVAGS